MLPIDNAGKLAAIEVVSIGTINVALAEQREILCRIISFFDEILLSLSSYVGYAVN